MTDYTDHRAEAERMLGDADEWAAEALMLGDADEWAAEAGELSPRANERACLDRAAVHALLAIHDTLTAADRYAANEAKQREAGADPLDEDDHRDRMTPNGIEWRRTIAGCWHPTINNVQSRRYRCNWSLAFIQSLHGPLAFAPDADGAPSVTAPVPDDPADDAVDGEEGERRYLNAQTEVEPQGVEDRQ